MRKRSAALFGCVAVAAGLVCGLALLLLKGQTAPSNQGHERQLVAPPCAAPHAVDGDLTTRLPATLGRAAALCSGLQPPVEASGEASGAALAEVVVPGSVLFLERMSGTPRWDVYKTGWLWPLPVSEKDVRAVTCLETGSVDVGRYVDERTGQPLIGVLSADRRFVDARLIRLADGRQMAAERFWGSGPPRKITYDPRTHITRQASSSEIADSPSMQAEKWLLGLRSDPTWLLSSDSVNELAFSPGGETLATVAIEVNHGTSTVTLWEVATGRQKLRLGEADDWKNVRAIAFSPDGGRIAIAGGDQPIRLLAPDTGRLITTLRHPEPDPILGVTAIAFHPDGTLVSGGGENVVFWDVASGKSTRRWTFPSGVYDLRFSPDGRMLAVGTSMGLEVRDNVSGRKLMFTHGCDEFAFSPDGAALIATTEAGAIRLWDLRVERGFLGQILKSGSRVIGRYAEPAYLGLAPVKVVAFHPAGRLLVTGGPDGLRLWSPETGIVSAQCGQFVDALAFSPDGTILAAGGGIGVRLWRTAEMSRQ